MPQITIGMDIDKLTSKEFQEKLNKQIAHQILGELPEELIHFSRNPILNYCLNKKTGIKDKPTPRVLNNWMQNEIVKVDPNDKGRVKRFDKLESIWLNIVVELREFGVPIDVIKKTRNNLFKNEFNNFSLFKFYVFSSILREPQTLLIFKDGTVKVMSSNIYNQLLTNNKLQSHLTFNLTNFITPDYPNYSTTLNFELQAPLESVEKMKLLFFLKTGEFQYMKVKLSDGDVRYIENVEMLHKSDTVLKSFSNWSFIDIVVSIDDEAETIITSKK